MRLPQTPQEWRRARDLEALNGTLYATWNASDWWTYLSAPHPTWKRRRRLRTAVRWARWCWWTRTVVPGDQLYDIARDQQVTVLRPMNDGAWCQVITGVQAAVGPDGILLGDLWRWVPWHELRRMGPAGPRTRG